MMTQASVKVRKIGGGFILSAILVMLIMAIYTLFNDSAFFMWNKTREEILRCHFTFFTVAILALIGYYFLNLADQIDTESTKD